jgi:hypothetical protein
MSSEALRSRPQLSRRVALGNVGVAAAALSMSRGAPALAQRTMPTDSHSLVGIWKWAADPNTPDPEDAFGLFHALGTLPDRGQFDGSSRRCGRNTARGRIGLKRQAGDGSALGHRG